MLKAILKTTINEKDWLFMSWYRGHFGLFPALRNYITLRNNRVGMAPNLLTGGTVYLRPGTADQYVYDQIFFSKEYDIDLGDPGIIIDAGAHIGLSSVFFASKHPKATIIAIEPEPSNFEILLMNVKNYPNIKPMWAGIWSHKTHLRIQDPDVDTWSFRVAEDFSGNGIPALSVEDIMADLDIKNVDVLKIDIEGSELEVLKHSRAWIDAVKILIIELHDRFQPGCTEALQRAYHNHNYDKSHSGESIVISNIKRVTAELPH